ncbi:MAG: hypothetical protein H6Q18_835, partial [Bacteroidetes bacterium]|nr:hypothetical protein [Bacteroidota bacterium]
PGKIARFIFKFEIRNQKLEIENKDTDFFNETDFQAYCFVFFRVFEYGKPSMENIYVFL